jgi:Flp pilus assembly pilin Flp
MRRWFAWLIAVPLAVIGTLAGHAAGYRAAVPDAHERAHVLASSGHGYLEYAPLVVAVCLAIAALGVVATAVAAVRGRDTSGGIRQIAFVGTLAPVAFTLQELIERYAHDGQMHWGIVASAPFLIGLATQLPFGLLAAAIAFALVSAAQRVAEAIRARPPRRRSIATSFLSWLSADLPRKAVLARGYNGRGPPRLT